MQVCNSKIFALWSVAILCAAQLAALPAQRLVAVPEMERPEAILWQPASQRGGFERGSDAAEGLRRFGLEARRRWRKIRDLDLEDLSRHQLSAMRGYRLPKEPGDFTAQAIGRDAASGRIFLELRGPRLPADYEIVHRYLHLYTWYDPATATLGPIQVTIRGWVLE